MTFISNTITCLFLVALLLSFPKFWRVIQSWRFLLQGRVIMLKHARQVSTAISSTCKQIADKLTQSPHTAYSMPIPGNILHVVSSKDHWNDINKAHTSQLSPNAASREVCIFAATMWNFVE
jgi:hypothetical protein